MISDLTQIAEKNTSTLGIGHTSAQDSALFRSDPEFMRNLYNFAYDEVFMEKKAYLEPKIRSIVILAALLGCQCGEEFTVLLTAALNTGLAPIEAREIIYQAAAYMGFARIRPFLTAANQVFTERGITLPLEAQGTTIAENRREKGNQIQITIFGEGMRNNWNTGKPWRQTLNSWLAANCFGDYYTRGGLDIKTRELVTFCILAADGSCAPQLASHIAGNITVGNTKDLLIRAVLNMTPYIGYPRTLNAIACVEAAEQKVQMNSYETADAETFDRQNIFGKGTENTAFSAYFIGKSYLNPVKTDSSSPVAIFNVTFEPGCRNNWHIHHASSGGGQMIICTAGSGWYQIEGHEAVSMKPGDAAYFPPGIKHWHGAKANSWFSHLAFELPGENTSNEWLEPVSDDFYSKL